MGSHRARASAPCPAKVRRANVLHLQIFGKGTVWITVLGGVFICRKMLSIAASMVSQALPGYCKVKFGGPRMSSFSMRQSTSPGSF